MLYRLFGDKNGLLDAVADAAFEHYARRKQDLEVTDDPVADLYAGWDDHMAFAAENPALYQLMFTPRPHSAATAYRRILGLLEATLMRCAAAGALVTTPRLAAQLILPANIPSGQRVEDLLAHARWILSLYGSAAERRKYGRNRADVESAVKRP